MTTDVLDREEFLDSHRALAVCAREFDRLADDVTKRVTDLDSAQVSHEDRRAVM